MMLLIDAFICMHAHNLLTQKQPFVLMACNMLFGMHFVVVFDLWQPQWRSHTFKKAYDNLMFWRNKTI